ncbi:hypothetical protein [Pelagibacterium xiamenense]|uniref:hypothetical protein n=1 Tax=Pelagibacterium xiamenense TaxID=2901140 RepID=UPI001E55E16E|nr:hypothetical protein [Pelagibacterium xiamenense]MCD7060755.1 hypothetical protein [Pelagibacterium xiamenense]
MAGIYLEREIVCPHCGATNHITVDEVADNTRVNCSRCHAEIGLWRTISPQTVVRRNAEQTV